MRIDMTDVLVIDNFEGTSKEGRPYARLRLLIDKELFELYFGGTDVEKVKDLQPQTVVSRITFELVPSFRGGVRIRPGW